eukprot:m51a1_g12010 hypothetical protein (191) ;mRNA; r:378-7428
MQDPGEPCEKGNTLCNDNCTCKWPRVPSGTFNVCTLCGNDKVDDWREECDDHTAACVACRCAAGTTGVAGRCVDNAETTGCGGLRAAECGGKAECVWCGSRQKCMAKVLEKTCEECALFDMSPSAAQCECGAHSSSCEGTAGCRSCATLGTKTFAGANGAEHKDKTEGVGGPEKTPEAVRAAEALESPQP